MHVCSVGAIDEPAKKAFHPIRELQVVSALDSQSSVALLVVSIHVPDLGGFTGPAAKLSKLGNDYSFNVGVRRSPLAAADPTACYAPCGP